MLKSGEVVFLLDVDNTLLDNDRFAADLGDRLERSFGAAQRTRYWAIFARVREQLGLADYLGSLQAFRAGLDDDPELLQMSQFMLEYPFAARLFPRALEAVAHLSTLGRPAILSDGDVVFQPRKIQRSGIWDAVEGRVMIYVHKERVLDHVQERYPANHYVMVDDKPNLLAAMKSILGDKLTAVFVRQGHYALAPESNSVQPAPDMTIERIEDLIHHTLSDFQVPP
ncbi:MAG TPA: HAD family hydrolase [Steroidobacteraceae bacterium]|nr:HAD family hydrolase [Steroidobacteraceae bacterium]